MKQLQLWRFVALAPFRFVSIFLLGVLISPSFLSYAQGASRDYYCIVVQDSQTGRGVPLVELRTVSNVRYYTDSNGIAALDDPELMGQIVYFKISSPGYEYPKDGFGYTGIALKVTAGGRDVIKINRVNIAERLYRITGAGIYRDSILVGQSVPLKNPLLDGLVTGQDTVVATPYHGGIYWFFGDTNRPSYPLGQFSTSGAFSLLPGKGGLDPSLGIDLVYWTDDSGFSRPMISTHNPDGPIWVGGLFVLKEQGREFLLTHFVWIDKDTQKVVKSGLAEFDDKKAIFEPVCEYPIDNPLHLEGEPFLVYNSGLSYLYCETDQRGAFPLVRCIADLKDISNPSSYESFTCLAPGERFRGDDTRLDRSADGRLVWGWKRNTSALEEDEAAKLIASGKIRPDEAIARLRDIDSDQLVISHGGSVFWNAYRKKWILITTQMYGLPSFLGEVWYAEADTPVGPWLYAKRVATHNGYTFYNPTQHPFFDQDGGRIIYFEGTYTDTYTDVKDVTPRYNYNQIMYRLTLDDPRLSLPSPIYQVVDYNGKDDYLFRNQLVARHLQKQIRSIPFYAVSPDRVAPGLIPVYRADNGGLQTISPDQRAPLFLALPASPSEGEKSSPSMVGLYEYTNSQTGYRWYAPDQKSTSANVIRSAERLCRVWRNPSSVLTLDWSANAAPDSP